MNIGGIGKPPLDPLAPPKAVKGAKAQAIKDVKIKTGKLNVKPKPVAIKY
jgi:hypothetical protein